MFELFDHTADLGIRVRSPTLPDLFQESALALTHCLIESPVHVREQATAQISLKSADTELLLFDWLSELLYRFETKGFLLARSEVQLTASSLQATLHGESIDARRHRHAHEVKAITYHGLRVESSDGGWLAEVIVDI